MGIGRDEASVADPRIEGITEKNLRFHIVRQSWSPRREAKRPLVEVKAEFQWRPQCI